jgi:TatD DNase family protein
MSLLFDTHVHLDVAAFADDRAAVLQRARAVGVVAQLVPAIDRAGWSQLAALAAQERDLHPAYGLHPVALAAHALEDLQALERWLETHAAVAVGEIGLDAFIPEIATGPAWDRQWQLFTGQLDIARHHGLPVILHARRALDPLLKALRQHRGMTGIVHSFSGSQQQAEQLLDLGFCLGVGGPVTYPRAQRLRRLVAVLPETAWVLETDAPDQPGCARRGQRNEPAFLPEILQTVAELRAMPPAQVARMTADNACRVLGLPALSA